MKRLAAVGAVGVDRALSGPVVHTGAGAVPVGKLAEKRVSPKPDGLLNIDVNIDGMSARDGSAAPGRRCSAGDATDGRFLGPAAAWTNATKERSQCAALGPFSFGPRHPGLTCGLPRVGGPSGRDIGPAVYIGHAGSIRS